MKFKFIHKLTSKEINKLLKIVSDEDNMKELGNGTTWDKDKINEIMKYSKIDYKNNFNDSNYLYIIMIVNKKVIGIGYIHPGLRYYNKCCVQNAILIDKKHRNKGYGKILNDMLIKLNDYYIKKPLLSFVKITNAPSNKVYKRFKLQGQLLFNDIKYNVYKLN